MSKKNDQTPDTRTPSESPAAQNSPALDRFTELRQGYEDRITIAMDEELQRTGGTFHSRGMKALTAAIASMLAGLHVEIEDLRREAGL